MNENIGILITGLIIGLVIFIIYKQFTSQWKGKMIDKKIVKEQDDDGITTKKRRLYFETEDGKRKTQDVGRREFENAQVGDIYEKKKGSFKAKRVAA